VMLGHSYLLITISRASDAHSSPLKKAGVVLSFGWVENRAEMAQTASMRTGGTVPALEPRSVSQPNKIKDEEHLPQLSHKTWLV
jgi:hypothetical protein